MLRVIYGLLCDREGRPVAIELFPGGVHDDKTLPAQIAKLRPDHARAGDRPGHGHQGQPGGAGRRAGVGWITALKAPQVKRLVREGALQLSLFDEHNLAEIESADYPGERLVVCRNPLVAAERARKRDDLLAATEAALAPIRERVEAGTLAGAAEIALAVGQVIGKRKVKKHFQLVIEDGRFDYSLQAGPDRRGGGPRGLLRPAHQPRRADARRPRRRPLLQTARLRRTRLPHPQEPELEIRPIRHRREDRVRAHAFLCLLTYYLERHLRHAWAPLLFQDEQPPLAADPVAKAERSPAAKRKASTQRTASGEVCHSFRSLLAELALIVRNSNRVRESQATFDTVTDPNRTQARALELLEQIPKHA